MGVDEDTFLMDEIGDRWAECWAAADRFLGGFSAHEKLDRSLAAFIAHELESDDDEHDKATLIGVTLAAVTRTGTHSKSALTASIERLKAPPRKQVFSIGRADTHGKRLALIAFPFFAVIDIFLLTRDLDHYGWEPSLSFALFFMASALCLVLAFSGLSDWIAVRDRS